MTDLLAFLGGLALIAVGLGRRAALRGRTSGPALRQAHRFALCLGAALLVLAPASALAVERAVGVPGLPMLLGDMLRMLAVACLGLLAGGPVRRRAAAASLVLLALPALFAAARLDHADGHLFVPDGHRPALAAYDAVLVLYPALQLAALWRAVGRRARRAAPGPHRTGLRLLAAATAAGLVWTAWGLDDVRLALLTGRQTDGDDTVSTVLGLLCAALVGAGGSAAAWPALRHRRWCRRTYRALGPLWSALHRAFPETALPGPRRPLRFALYRRVIEIHDGLLLLRPHLPPPAPGTDAPHVAAARIAAALRSPAAAPGSPPAGIALTPAADPDEAAAQLAAVSRAFARLAPPSPRSGRRRATASPAPAGKP
ncbi:MAB_1171c family putative transporter [Streptomyces caatingaensis]|uniref:MAB_1171c family putative transporter n=1 Tax=Streptomyces caatingaensis TaxID=1678637 RepID=UPI000672754B|nr:MAB_1171c family putative transporter [Streptomyces caatingaensis]